MKTISRYFLLFWTSFKNSFRLFKKHDTLTLGAALSYYTGFSLIPITVMVITISGLALGPATVEHEMMKQLSSVLGPKGSEELRGIIRVAYQPDKSFIATLLATVLLLIGATSVFSQLHTSLNLIWDVKLRARQPILRFFINRVFSFAMIICLCFLLLVSFLVHAFMAVFSSYLDAHLPHTSLIYLTTSEMLLSFGFTTLLFGLIFKYMSDARPPWRYVWPGAFFTAFLFAIGKYLLGFYISMSDMDDSYGAAGSIILLLTWVFFSSQIVFFGAEFTHAFAAEHGVLLDPFRVRADADEGLKHVNEGKVKAN